MSRHLESKDRYEVEQHFFAYRDQEEGYGLDSCQIRKGSDVWADVEFWRGKRWEGFEVVKFLCGQSSFCIDRATFIRSTKKAN